MNWGQARVPGRIRSDNGTEFIAKVIRRFLGAAGVGTLYIEPRAPWQNGYVESFNSKLRDEFLNLESFADLAEARSLSVWWRNEYNHRRSHSSLGYRTPTQFAASHSHRLPYQLVHELGQAIIARFSVAVEVW